MKNNNKISPKFIWPNTNFSFNTILSKVTPENIESELQNIYPNIYPVLFSSARAGLVHLLTYLRANKLSNIWTPYYSSHCVLSSVSRVGFPTPEISGAKIAIVYHQWGLRQNYYYQNQSIIEDSADSFFLPGEIIFPSNGNFQLVSLPKSLGTFGGGVLFCRSEQDALAIKKVRNLRISNTAAHFCMKLFGRYNKQFYYYWDSFESAQGYPPTLLCNDILSKLRYIHKYVDKVKRNVMLFKEAGIFYDQENSLSDRLPCAIPFRYSKSSDEIIGVFIKEYRMFNMSYNYNEIKFEKVLPIPTHKDVDEYFIKKLIERCIQSE